jgi:hypothetical protein
VHFDLGVIASEIQVTLCKSFLSFSLSHVTHLPRLANSFALSLLVCVPSFLLSSPSSLLLGYTFLPSYSVIPSSPFLCPNLLCIYLETNIHK